MKINTLKQGDIIGIVAPSRPIYNIKKEISEGIKNIQSRSFLVKESKFINKKDYYSAGTAEQRISDLHDMFTDKNVKAIICATGGATANQLLEDLDFNLIKSNPKIFMGYSNITALLLAINKKTDLITFYGPNIRELSSLTKNAQNFIFNMFEGKKKFLLIQKRAKL